MIQVMALSLLLASFDSTKLAAAERGMALQRLLALEMGCHAAGLLATILWASAYRDIWALVVGAQVAVVLPLVLGH